MGEINNSINIEKVKPAQLKLKFNKNYYMAILVQSPKVITTTAYLN